MIVHGLYNFDPQALLRLIKNLQEQIKVTIDQLVKIFEKLLHDQLSKYMEDKLSPLLCGFRKKYSTQHALLRMIERWRHCLDNSGATAAVPNGPFKSLRLYSS